MHKLEISWCRFTYSHSNAVQLVLDLWLQSFVKIKEVNRAYVYYILFQKLECESIQLIIIITVIIVIHSIFMDCCRTSTALHSILMSYILCFLPVFRKTAERAHLIRAELCNSNGIECTELLFQSKLSKSTRQIEVGKGEQTSTIAISS